MKSLQNFIITEAAKNVSTHLIKATAQNIRTLQPFEDALKAFLKNSKVRYSFNNKLDLQKFFNDFKNARNISASTFKELGFTDGAKIAHALIEKKDILEKEGWVLKAISSFDESKLQQEYKAWKKSDKYVEGKKLNRDEYKNADEEELERTLVIYDHDNPGNPDTTLEYPFYGMRSKDNMEQVHMLRMDWCYATGLNYYKNARECLLPYYLKKTDAELAEVEQAVTDDEIDGIKYLKDAGRK